MEQIFIGPALGCLELVIYQSRELMNYLNKTIKYSNMLPRVFLAQITTHHQSRAVLVMLCRVVRRG